MRSTSPQHDLPVPSPSTQDELPAPSTSEHDHLPSTSADHFLNLDTLEKMRKKHQNAMSRISNLKSSLRNENNYTETLKRMLQEGNFNELFSEMNDVEESFIASQLRNENRNVYARTYSAEDKTFALSFYIRSPKVYRYFAYYFCLPSVSTVKKFLSEINFEAGINKDFFNSLQLIVRNMEDIDRNCILMFSEIALSPGFQNIGHLSKTVKPVDHALVFMIRGIHRNFKQVVAYYFCKNPTPASTLTSLIKEVIQKLQSISFKVRATVCEQGTTNRSAISQLCLEHISDHYFIINGQRIFTLFDVPHLLKSTRNCLLRCKIQFGEGKFAKFEHIENLFRMDYTSGFRTLKLTNSHFDFRHSFSKMKVQYAAQILSNSVGACINSYISLGHLPSEACYTAEFVILMNSLFDSLNSMKVNESVAFSDNNDVSSVDEDAEEDLDNDFGHYANTFINIENNYTMKFPLTDNTEHIKFWTEFLENSAAWKLIDMKSLKDLSNQYHFVKGWQTTVKAVMGLWEELRSEGFESLSTRTLNQDPIENLFHQIRLHGMFITNPTCYQFVAILKSLVVNRLTSEIIEDGTTELDDAFVLDDLTDHLEQNTEYVEDSHEDFDLIT